ncbi:AraC family transcriptional regulator [Brevibacillus centrosporus]|uniref:AraC family transcriptional regulator n=1 Tax=Brevibacillus centrosporus TaxID=54910 RepID=UPI000F0A7948|nr:AraC family transcriptional regulator [Brevibacillus centrosporus]MEC2129960.1 AraC family transcriptional regulator [Brevibacillus centrosporus]RNB71887.1 AraC family transcriptional regulator [Brevibacillus centrosporus]GED32453.1 transcriptional regulator [Brevibacillus centrosporus]
MKVDDGVNELRSELVAYIEKYTGEDGTHTTRIPDLQLIRSSEKTERIHSIHEPALCIVAQGKKVMMLGNETYLYDPTSYLVVSLQLPVSGQVLEASSERPYLCLRLNFDKQRIFDLVKQSVKSSQKTSDSQRALFISKMNRILIDAVVRLIRLLDTPEDIPVMAPLITQEILYRILKEEQGLSMKQFAMIGSHAERIAKVVQMIEGEYNQPLHIASLSAAVNMSPSSLHHHFKEITAMSPLQYQKQVRLQEARRILLTEAVEAADAGFQVGYESPSQFNREYARMFGMPPMRDIKRLRDSLGFVVN